MYKQISKGKESFLDVHTLIVKKNEISKGKESFLDVHTLIVKKTKFRVKINYFSYSLSPKDFKKFGKSKI